MIDRPLVSVVLCSYNDERFLSETIKSILGQSYDKFEFVIWNDGSTDSTEKIALSFNDERIRYFYHENTGLGGALRLACTEARGKYIARIDGDDICYPDRLQKEVDFLEHHEDYVLVSGQMQYIDENDKELGSTFICSSDYIVRKRLPYGSTICHPASMFRKTAYDACGGYESLRFMEDHLFFQRLLKYGKVYILPDLIIKYRIRKGSLIQSNLNNPYSDLLDSYRNKMIKDNEVNPHDVNLYNQIYLLSKQLPKNELQTINDKKRHNSLQLLVFDFLKPIIGEEKSRKIIISFKSIIYYFKLSL